MKRNDWIIILATALYSILFYQQLLGINLFVFNLLLIMLLMFKNNQLIKSKSFLLSATMSLLSSFSCYLHNSELSIVMNIFSLLITAATAMNPDTSIIINLFHAIYTEATVAGYMIYDLFKKEKSSPEQIQKKTGFLKKLLLSIVPIVISAIFFMLYRESNIAFKLLSDKINFSFISISWIGFTLLGFVLVYGFFMQRSFARLLEVDKLKSDDLFDKYGEDSSDWFQSIMTFKSEWLTALMLFTLINIITLSVNITDIMYTWSMHSLPKGVTYSEYLHSGIFSLILSIVFAIIIILFYFRGALNYYKSNGIIKALAYVWIIQNVFLIASTLMRTKMYVDTYSLTEKRVGVFIYLGLAVLGLVLCFYKIAFKKNNVFLLRKNMWAIYISLCCLSFIDWSYCISAYNIYRAKKSNNFYVDASYMGELNENNFAVVWNYYESLPASDFRKAVLKTLLDQKLNTILLKYNQYDYRSITYRRQALHQFILALNKDQKINSLNANTLNLQDLNYLKNITGIDTLNLSNNQLKNIDLLEGFAQLSSLDLSGNTVDSIKHMPKLDHLLALDISATNSKNLQKIKNYNKLESLNIADNALSSINELKQFPNLHTIDISNNRILDLESLAQLEKLESLTIRNVLDPSNELPYIPSLKFLDMSNSSNNSTANTLHLSEETLGSLISLNIAQCNLINLNILRNMAASNRLEKLDVSNNGLTSIGSLTYLPTLKELNLSQNNLSADTLLLPASLTMLNLENTNCRNYSFLNQLPRLQELNISNNYLEIRESVTIPSLEVLNVCNSHNCFYLKNVFLPNLKELYINQSDISDYSFIKSMKKLEKIAISNIDKELGSILLGMKNLKKIECNSIDDKSYNELISKYPGIWIIKNDQYRYSRSEISSDSF